MGRDRPQWAWAELRQGRLAARGRPGHAGGEDRRFENGFPWFKITYSGGGSGYQWGGILCAIGEARAELFQTCTTKAERDGAREAAPQLCRDNGGEWGDGQCWPKGHYSRKTKKNRTGLSCKELKARCSRTDRDDDCKRYLDSCTGHGDN